MLTNNTQDMYKLNIAGIIIQFTAAGNISLSISEIHRQFLVNSGQPDCHLRVHYGPLPPMQLQEKLFDSGAVWALYRTEGNYAITFRSDVLGSEPYQVALVDSDFKNGDLYIRPVPRYTEAGEHIEKENTGIPCVVPAAYPLDEVFMVNLLARGRGVEFHACGVSNHSKGLIFTGQSGAGKSTMSRLWKDNKDTVVLSDERIIVRNADDRFWVYGTPWQSNAGAASPQHVLLDRIFFIKHSPKNYALKLKAGDAVSRLFVRCFPTFWDEECLKYTLDMLGRIAECVPCYELGFVPDHNVLDFIEGLNSEETNH